MTSFVFGPKVPPQNHYASSKTSAKTRSVFSCQHDQTKRAVKSFKCKTTSTRGAEKVSKNPTELTPPPPVETPGGGGIGIVQFLEKKSFFITGATGFVAKVFVEKMLRTVPNVNKMFLMIKANSKEAAMERMKTEIINSELFDCLKEIHGESYQEFMLSKLVPVVGTLTEPDLGMNSSSASAIQEEVDVIINSAANTTLDERYDFALNINTRGPGWLMSFAKKCKNLRLFLHLSTAYANGRVEGTVFEKSFYGSKMVTSQNPTISFPQLDIESEVNLAFKLRDSCQDNSVVQKMRELGMERSTLYGWPNTYLFTKAMGEMLINGMRGDLPVVIIRPTMIESSIKAPFRGWIEGNRVLDPLIISYGKGQLPAFLADPKVRVDVIPVDMVVHTIIAAIAKHGIEGKPESISYHVASSVVNPILIHQVFDYSWEHFVSSPFVDAEGKRVGINGMKFFSSMEDLAAYLWTEIAKQNGLEDAKVELDDKAYQRLERRCQKKLEHALYLSKIYKPYMFFKGWFHNGNSQKLVEEMSKEEMENFQLDCRTIEWRDYILNTHVPGVRKHVMKGRGSS